MDQLKPADDQHSFQAVTSGIISSQPLGTPLPPNDPHAITVSVPTWDSVDGLMEKEHWVKSKMQTCYPRFGINPCVKALTKMVLERLTPPEHMDCLIFVSEEAAGRFGAVLKDHNPELPLLTARFFLPGVIAPEAAKWGNFVVVYFDTSLQTEAMSFWREFGDNISSRQAQFCLALVPYMRTDSAHPEFRSSAPRSDITTMVLPKWVFSPTNDDKDVIKSVLAKTTSSQDIKAPKPIEIDDVFLYTGGMRAISTLARALHLTSPDPAVVVYGWPYAGTAPCIKGCGYNRFTMYGHGTDEELDQLEASLESGSSITALFCEITSNPALHTPDLHRIRSLADRYNFLVAVDNTIGTSVNVDILPYADVVITSLTKIVNGACNAMGGSLITNPNSPHYDTIHNILRTTYDDLLFPEDAKTLAQNSADYVARARQCSVTARSIAHFIAAHPSVDYVFYPTMVESRARYERYRRPGEGYGYLLSIVFRDPESAVVFYNVLDLWKGPTVGTNWSIAIPYSLLAHCGERDWAAEYGIPKQIVRLSVGLEEEGNLEEKIGRALEVVEETELRREMEGEEKGGEDGV